MWSSTHFHYTYGSSCTKAPNSVCYRSTTSLSTDTLNDRCFTTANGFQPKSFDTGKRNMVVLDDLMAETDGRVTEFFTKKSHHSNTSVIYIVQNLFPKHKESRTIRLNVQNMVVFKNPRDASQVTHLAKQMYPGRVNFVQEAFKDATNVPYGYLLVDLKQDTPEDLRQRTTILPDDAVQYVYVPKL